MAGEFDSYVDGYVTALHQNTKFYLQTNRITFDSPFVLMSGMYKCKSVYKKSNHSHNFRIDVSPSSFNYSHCECNNGYFGKPPNYCTLCSHLQIEYCSGNEMHYNGI